MASTSVWQLRIDLVSARALLWVATASGTGEVKPEVYRYLGDRYRRLADHQVRRGRPRTAERLAAKARWYFRLGGEEDPPPTAAAAMPAPPRPRFTRAIGMHHGGRGPDDAAWSISEENPR